MTLQMSIWIRGRTYVGGGDGCGFLGTRVDDGDTGEC